MEPSTVASLFGLTLVTAVAVVATSFVVTRLRTILIGAALPLTAAVATGAMAGSLYFSEVADFVPCKLCWFQRIAMYPLAVILVLATVFRDRGVFRYVVPVATLGLAIAGYHIWIQVFPETSNLCEFNNPCSAKWVEAFGVITIPQMAALSFALVIALGVMSLRTQQLAEQEIGDDL